MAKVNILLVDDLPANLLALEAVLEGPGRNLVRARSGGEALRLLEGEDFAVILLDVQMPGLDGFETARRARSGERERNRRTPIIFVTAHEDGGLSAEKAYELGAVDYLVKPLVPVILRAKVAGFIELFEKGEEVKRQAERLRQLERREFEERLIEEAARRRDSEQRFAWFMKQLPGLAWIKDADGRYVYANEAAERAFQVTADDLYGKTDDEVFPPETAARFKENDRKALTGQSGVQVVETLEDADHCLRYSLVTKFPIPSRCGQAAMVGGIAIDITDFKNAEEALRQSEARFHTLADTIPQLAWMARPDGHIVWYNKRWFDYTGTTYEDMEGWGWKALHDPAELARVVRNWSAALASGEPWEDTFPLRRHDGEMRWHLSRALPLRDKLGRVLSWFGTNTDITDRMRTEEELRAAKEEAEAANKAKDQFLAVLSHELRTPLNPILLAVTSMLGRPAPAHDEVRPNLEMIRQNVEIEARLIDDLLDVMRIVTGKMPLHWEVADAHASIRKAIDICRGEVLTKCLRLEVDLAAGRHYLDADSARLQQVFWNLIKNAVKFTPGGGSVAIRTRNRGETVGGGETLVIEVSDTGIGIEPDVLGRIFDPFQQGETSITRRFGGLGLGLAISKGIVEGHGGRLTVESAGKDRGATFRITLRALPAPAVDDHAPRPAPDDDSAARPLRPRNILLVEDEQATLRLMARLLRGLGHAVTTAGTVAEALARFGSGDFDLIVSDIGLPDGSGLDLMRQVVSLRGPVLAIALTGYGMEEDIQRSRDAGFLTHMTKPIDFKKLEATIQQITA